MTRSPHDTYTLMVYENNSKTSHPIVGKRLLVKEFKKSEDLTDFMRTLLSKPVRAFVY